MIFVFFFVLFERFNQRACRRSRRALIIELNGRFLIFLFFFFETPMTTSCAMTRKRKFRKSIITVLLVPSLLLLVLVCVKRRVGAALCPVALATTSPQSDSMLPPTRSANTGHQRVTPLRDDVQRACCRTNYPRASFRLTKKNNTFAMCSSERDRSARRPGNN